MKRILLNVTSRPETFSRAGRTFSRTPTPIWKDELTDEQFRQIAKEPNLAVVVTEVVTEVAAKGGSAVLEPETVITNSGDAAAAAADAAPPRKARGKAKGDATATDNAGSDAPPVDKPKDESTATGSN